MEAKKTKTIGLTKAIIEERKKAEAEKAKASKEKSTDK